MKPKDRLRDYNNRFFENRNECIRVRDDQIVESYKKGIKDRKLFENIHESGATNIKELMNVVNKLMDTEEALQIQFDADAPGTSGTAADKLCKRPSEVLAVEGC